MAEEEKKEECCTDEGKKKHGNCSCCKFMAGVLVGLLIAGTALGIYLAGKCKGGHCCMMSHHPMAMSEPAQPSK